LAGAYWARGAFHREELHTTRSPQAQSVAIRERSRELSRRGAMRKHTISQIRKKAYTHTAENTTEVKNIRTWRCAPGKRLGGERRLPCAKGTWKYKIPIKSTQTTERKSLLNGNSPHPEGTAFWYQLSQRLSWIKPGCHVYRCRA